MEDGQERSSTLKYMKSPKKKQISPSVLQEELEWQQVCLRIVEYPIVAIYPVPTSLDHGCLNLMKFVFLTPKSICSEFATFTEAISISVEFRFSTSIPVRVLVGPKKSLSRKQNPSKTGRIIRMK